MAEINLLEQDKLESNEAPKTAFDRLNDWVKPHIETIKEMRAEQLAHPPQMPVHEYIEHFLALHCGFQEDDAKYNMNDWIDFAGSVFMPVDLIDSTGTIVAQVPSLVPSEFFVLTNEDKDPLEGSETLGNTMDRLDQYSRTYKEAAERERINFLDMLSSRVDNKVMDGHRAKWTAFFDKMGILNPDNYRKVLGGDEVTKPEEKTFVNTTNVEFTFDEDE